MKGFVKLYIPEHELNIMDDVITNAAKTVESLNKNRKNMVVRGKRWYNLKRIDKNAITEACSIPYVGMYSTDRISLEKSFYFYDYSHRLSTIHEMAAIGKGTVWLGDALVGEYTYFKSEVYSMLLDEEC